jgi:uncharacterized protein
MRDDSTVEAQYQRGLALALSGEWFEAHEAFELAWRGAAPEERDFFQGLVHVVVCAYQAGRGRPVATGSQRAKALRRLGPYAPSHRGLDVAAILAALDRAETDFRQQLVQHGVQPPAAVEEEE